MRKLLLPSIILMLLLVSACKDLIGDGKPGAEKPERPGATNVCVRENGDVKEKGGNFDKEKRDENRKEDERDKESAVACDEYIVDFSDFDPNKKKDAEKALANKGYEKRKECLCGLDIQLWVAVSPDLQDDPDPAKELTDLQDDDTWPNFEIIIDTPEIKETYFDGRIGPGNGRKKHAVVVAIVDSGIDFEHDALQGLIWKNPDPANFEDDCVKDDTMGYDFRANSGYVIDKLGHGTHVAGIIAKEYPRDIDLKLMPLKFHNGQQGFLFDALCAIYYAINKEVDVINLSWGFKSNEVPTVLKKAIDLARKKDIIVVTSAGNELKDNGKAPYHWPSNLGLENMAAVAAYDETSATKLYATNSGTGSNYGVTTVDLAAPGRNINSTYLDNGFVFLSGTSMAAADVSRTASILKAKSHPGITHKEILGCIFKTVIVESPMMSTIKTGGHLNHKEADKCAFDNGFFKALEASTGDED